MFGGEVRQNYGIPANLGFSKALSISFIRKETVKLRFIFNFEVIYE